MSLLKCLKLLPEPGKNSGNPQIRSSFPKAVKQSVCLTQGADKCPLWATISRMR